jgi:HD-GYP domain-containing protein (c-di-GMP phosphodiesterase class II)
MTMRFRSRAFLICFIPFAALLACSFWMIQGFVQSTVRAGLRGSVRENQLAIANIHAKVDLQNSRFLKVAGENVALKAGMGLLLSDAGSEAARTTVEDQLRELGEHMGFDFMLVSAPNGAPLAGVVRQAVEGPGGHGQLVPVDTVLFDVTKASLLKVGDHTFQVASVPVDQNDENVGALSVGEYFDVSEFTTPAVLIHNGKVIESNIPGIPYNEFDAALGKCGDQSDCDARLQGINWISLPLQSFGGGYLLRSFENVDKVTAPIQSKLRNLFLTVALVSVLVGFLCSIASSRSIVKPIAALVSHMRNAVHTGVMLEFKGHPSSILEIRELAENYNRAVVSVRAAGEDLDAAYLEFIGSLANALDARDRYTAGHSERVSQLSSLTAASMNLAPDHVERIRIGALLHDIGKIGVADSVLQKPGRLTADEYSLVKEHPVIGRRILEGVQGLAPFLEAVELHHENWDGSGYPKGQSREETPVDARIIHVSDAYDAMTTDRAYRQGMTHEKAISILIEYAAIQFDPRIVDIFTSLPRAILTGQSALPECAVGVEELAKVATQ